MQIFFARSLARDTGTVTARGAWCGYANLSPLNPLSMISKKDLDHCFRKLGVMLNHTSFFNECMCSGNGTLYGIHEKRR